MNDERAFLVRSLADLDAERAAGDLDEADYTDLRARYERKLATLSGSGRDPARGDATGHDQNGGGGRRWGRTVATVALVAVIAVGAGLAMAGSSGRREPGQNISGRAIEGPGSQLARAAQLQAEGKVSDAIAVYQSVLDENPENVQALTYFGWMLRNQSRAQEVPQLLESGIALIERATAIDADYPDAWFFRGIIYLRDEDDPQRAVDALRLALAAGPIPEIETAARELLAEIAQQASSTTSP